MIFQPSNREIKGTKKMRVGLSLVSKILEIFKRKIRIEDTVKGDFTQGNRVIVLLLEEI